jgi:fatty-acyl-CoA synthase
MGTGSFAEVWTAPLTPLSFLERSARVFPERTALIYGAQRLSYRQLAERVYRLADALRSAGVAPGDRVAILCPNTPPLLEAHFAVPLLGAILVAINTRLSAEEVGYILEHSEARVLLVDSELAPLALPALGLASLQQVVTIVDDQAAAPAAPPNTLDYAEFLAGGSPEPRAPEVAEHDTIAINYTSGTTGRPKGVMYAHRGAYLNALGQALELGLDSSSVYLWVLPMFHCNGWCFPWAVTAVGGTHVCLRRFDVPLAVRLINEHCVSHFCAAPTVLIMLTNHPAVADLRPTRPLRIGTGGAPPSPTTVAAVEAAGAQLIHLYGLTETYGPASICEWHPEWDALPAEERARLKARQGAPYITCGGLRVVDDAMRDVPADGQTMGEVVLRGNTVMQGYYRQPDASAEAFRDGWFHSGDLAVVHPDGYLELRDRKKDIIISGGENISTIEVERAIYQHPAVLECAVIAAPHELWGEVPWAFVTLKDGQTLDEKELIGFCRERLAHFKVPKAVEFGELPKTSTGKIQKFVLRARAWSERQTL